MSTATRLAALMLALSAMPAIAAGAAGRPSTAPQECAKPEYPVRWQEDGQNRNVVVAFLVDADGRVAASKVVQSSGHMKVDRASVRAIERCTFAPAAGAPAWSKVRYSWIVE